jgi:hypothetical protein
VLTLGEGTGLVYILRWYWWRINAWSEIAAMTAALVVSVALRASGTFDAGTPAGFAATMLTTVAMTTATWLIATFATAPEPHATRVAFYRRVRPGGPGWTAIAVSAGEPSPHAGRDTLAPAFANWLLGIVVVYATLFAIGEVLFSNLTAGLALGALALGCAVWLATRLD